MPISTLAKNYDKEFIKIIKQHDVPVAARNLPMSEPLEKYWELVLEENAVLKNFYRDISKKKGAEKDAIATVSRMRLFDYRLDVEIIEDFREFCDTLIWDMGLPSEHMELNVIYDPTPNAFATLTDRGFAICLNTGLLKELDYDYYRIMGVVAHEYAHGAMMHHIRTEYEFEKKKRKDKVIGGIAIGLNAAAQMADAYTSGITGTQYDASKYTETYEKIASDMKLSPLKFRYKYNRDLELEADLFAYRFLERLGLAHKYSEALQMISGNTMYFWHDDSESDHPSTSYRLEFLNFLASHPEYVNEVKEKGAKKE